MQYDKHLSLGATLRLVLIASLTLWAVLVSLHSCLAQGALLPGSSSGRFVPVDRSPMGSHPQSVQSASPLPASRVAFLQDQLRAAYGYCLVDFAVPNTKDRDAFSEPGCAAIAAKWHASITKTRTQGGDPADQDRRHVAQEKALINQLASHAQ